MPSRTCELPHKCISKASMWLREIPTTPMRAGQLALLTETGWVPYCGWTNQRANAAAGDLGRRFLDAKVVAEFALWPDNVRTLADGSPVPHYTEERFAIPQMVLSMALAEREERFCVAEHLRARIAARMRP